MINICSLFWLGSQFSQLPVFTAGIAAHFMLQNAAKIASLL
ncbi:hypothetical protein LACWKB8_1797 [Lactobacillus sp. wkB8]|nr:hypothetical protein LACWKB8_1797 [Lactobacillus sp. wkB8]